MGNQLAGCCCCDLFTLEIPSDWATIIAQPIEDPPAGETDEQLAARENRNALRELLEPQDDGWIRIRHYLPTQSFDLTLGIGGVPIDSEPGNYVPLELDASIATEPRTEDPETIWESRITHEVSVTEQYAFPTVLNLRTSRVHEACRIQDVEFDLTNLSGNLSGQYVATSRVGTTPSGVATQGRRDVVETAEWPLIDPQTTYAPNVVNIPGEPGFLAVPGVSLRWISPDWFIDLFRQWSPAPARETCYLRVRPTFNTEGVCLLLTAKKVMFRRDVAPESFAQRDNPRQFRRRKCDNNEICRDNGPTHSNPRWIIDRIDTPLGPVEFADPTVRAASVDTDFTIIGPFYATANHPLSTLLGKAEEQAAVDAVIQSATSRMTNPTAIYGGGTSVSFAPTQRASNFIDKVYATSTAFLRLRDVPDSTFELNQQRLLGACYPPAGLGSPVPGGFVPTNLAMNFSSPYGVNAEMARTSGDPSFAADITRFREMGQPLPWQGGGTANNDQPWNNVIATISVATPPAADVRLVTAILQFYYVTHFDDSTSEDIYTQGFARVQHAAVGDTEYYAGIIENGAGMLAIRPTPDESTAGETHAFHLLQGGNSFLQVERFEVAYKKTIPAWNGEPPVIEFSAADIDWDWFGNRFSELRVLTQVQTVITGKVEAPMISESLWPDTGDLDDVLEYDASRSLTNTGHRESTFTYLPLDVTQFAMRFKPADDAVGHPEPVVSAT